MLNLSRFRFLLRTEQRFNHTAGQCARRRRGIDMSKEKQERATPARVPVLQEESNALLLSFLMPKRAGVAENAAAARPISGKIPEYLQERGKRIAQKGCRETRRRNENLRPGSGRSFRQGANNERTKRKATE